MSVKDASTVRVRGASADAPSIAKYRNILLAIICALYFLAYLDRVAISVTAPKMIAEFHYSKATMGLIFAAFAYTYAFLQIPLGMVGDRLGPRGVLSFLMAWWSVFTLVTGAARNFTMLFIARLLFGAGEAGGFPVATRALSAWFPREKNGFLQGLLHACSRSGAAFSPPIVVALVVYSGSWRTAFYILGVLGLIWSICFYAYYRSNPASFAAVRQQQPGAAVEPAVVERAPIPWNRIVRSPDVWLLTFSYFCYGYTLWIYLTWLPTYLQDQRHLTFAQLGFFASLPLFGGVLGDLVGGTLSDFIYKRTGRLNLARRSVISASFLLTVCFVIPSLAVSSALVSAFLSFGALFMLECAVSNCWAVAMDLGGKRYCGTVSGVMNTGFGIAGFLSPIVFGSLVDHTGSWNFGFGVGSVLLVLGAITIAFVRPTKTIDTEPVAAVA